MATASTTVVHYPTFAEFLHERFRSGARPDVIAQQCGADEQTVIGWANGTMPGKQLWRRIEERLSYCFAERRFAEAAADAQFPPAEAPEDIRAIRTHAALIEYLAGATKIIVRNAIATFAGWSPSNLGLALRNPKHVIERKALARMLQRLPELPRHLRGERLSECTPTSILGIMLREYRQQRGESPRNYAARAGVSWTHIRYLEDVGRGMGKRNDPSRSSAIRNPETMRRITAFLEAERRELGPCAASAMTDAPVSEPVGDHGTDVVVHATVIRRLEAFVQRAGGNREASRQLGIPPSTVRTVLHRRTLLAKHAERIARALDAIAPEPLSVAASAHDPTPRSVEERLALLEAELASRRSGAETSPYVSPLSFARFRHRSEPVDDAELARFRSAIRAASEAFGLLASVSDDALRWRIRELIVPDVDELFLTLEGFLRQYPGASLETLESMRRFAADRRARAPRVGDGEPREDS